MYKAWKAKQKKKKKKVTELVVAQNKLAPHKDWTSVLLHQKYKLTHKQGSLRIELDATGRNGPQVVVIFLEGTSISCHYISDFAWGIFCLLSFK